MTSKDHIPHEDLDETTELKIRLEETEETLRAIQEYMVDAFVVNRGSGIQVVTLNESEIPYRMMVESMNEGAVTLIPDGTIFYCNSRFGEMIDYDCERLIGTFFQALIASEERHSFEESLKNASGEGRRGEFNLLTSSGQLVPVQLSMYPLGTMPVGGLAIIATDISERLESEAQIRTLASKLTLVEQEERHRISQVLHDDLQQRLFAIKAQLSFLNDFQDKDRIPVGAYMEIDQLQASLSEAIAITRNLSIDLNPVVLQGEGLAEAMTWLSFRMKEQYGLHIDIQAQEGFTRLDHHVRMLLFQSIRELLFNVVKHAGTLEANVTLEHAGGRSRIIISDQGKGFDSDTVMKEANTAHGLLIVQDRLRLLGYPMQVESTPGAGTRIVIEIPAEKEAA